MGDEKLLVSHEDVCVEYSTFLPYGNRTLDEYTCPHIDADMRHISQLILSNSSKKLKNIVIRATTVESSSKWIYMYIKRNMS